jgi:hypothetical protein
MSPGASDRKKLIVVAGLGVVLVVVVVIRLLPDSSGTADAAAASPLPVVLAPSATSELDADPKHLETVARIAKARSSESYAADDVRDPMVPLVRGRGSSGDAADGGGQEEAPAPASLPSMSLYGIVWDPANPIALIDGNDVHVGDTVKGARVVSIEVDRVVLSYRSRQFVLTVE